LRTEKFFRYSSRTTRMYQNQMYIRYAADRVNQEKKKINSFNFWKSTILYLIHRYKLLVEGNFFFNF